ncbi:MAG: tetratricopeptide repeat protein [Rariglobus sp.]
MMITLIHTRLPAGRQLRRTACAALALVALTAGATPWETVSTGLFTEAHTAFVETGKTAEGAELRLNRYGEAIALLNVQPRTQSNIDKAAGILDEVYKAAPGDDLGFEARYMLGRVEQSQRSTPDLAKADQIFSELIERNPAHPVAQRAQAKLAIIRLYGQMDEAERRRRYDTFTAISHKLTDPGAKTQLHLLLGEFAQRFNYGNEEDFAHTLAADKSGVIRRTLRVQVLARIGDLARLTGRKEVARDYYSRFLEQFPRTDRRTTIEGYLADLNSSK